MYDGVCEQQAGCRTIRWSFGPFDVAESRLFCLPAVVYPARESILDPSPNLLLEFIPKSGDLRWSLFALFARVSSQASPNDDG